MTLARSFPIACLIAFVACSSSTPPQAAPADGGADGGADPLGPSNACVDPLETIYGDPGALAPDASLRGNIQKCFRDQDLSRDTLQAELDRLGYKGKPLTSGARVYRVTYRTERGDARSTPAVSSSLVLVPDAPRAAAASLPVVVASRGSRGQAAACAASKRDAAADDVNPDLLSQIYPLVGAGFAVIVPDLPGYANYGAPNNPPSAYAQAADVGHATLDAARALKKLLPALDDKVVLVGHSQGGHTALAALALAETYGFTSPIVGVAVYAPLWVSQRTWGASLYRPVAKQFGIELANSAAGAVGLWYHYTQAELLDGPGEGKKLFAAGKQDAIKKFVDEQCWAAKYPQLEALGTYPDELYDPEFVSQVGFSSVGSNPCDPGSVCEKWLTRYSADRPRLTGKALTTPLLVLYGGKDTTLAPGRMRCALDRLAEDKSKLTVCVDTEQTHGGIVRERASYVSDWIASVTLGAPAPAACASDAAAITPTCETPPPND